MARSNHCRFASSPSVARPRSPTLTEVGERGMVVSRSATALSNASTAWSNQSTRPFSGFRRKLPGSVTDLRPRVGSDHFVGLGLFTACASLLGQLHHGAGQVDARGFKPIPQQRIVGPFASSLFHGSELVDHDRGKQGNHGDRDTGNRSIGRPSSKGRTISVAAVCRLLSEPANNHHSHAAVIATVHDVPEVDARHREEFLAFLSLGLPSVPDEPSGFTR